MTIDDRTPGRGYLLPNIDNKLRADVSRIRQSILAVDDDITGALLALAAKAPLDHGHAISDISGLAEALASKLDGANLSLGLSDLADVSATAPAGGQVLMRVSAAWVPVSLQINHVQGLELALTAVSSSAGSRWNAESVAAAAAITSPTDASIFALVVGGVLRSLTFANLKTTLKAAFDTAYAAIGHLHDDRYNTKSEITAALAGKSSTGHVHDDRYNTKGEVAGLIANGNVAAVGGWSQSTISAQIESRAAAYANSRAPYDTGYDGLGSFHIEAPVRFAGRQHRIHCQRPGRNVARPLLLPDRFGGLLARSVAEDCLMHLITVHSITATPDPAHYTCEITAELTSGSSQRIPFAYVPNDGAPITFEIAGWLLSHPQFSINPYVPPAPISPTTLTLTKRQIVRAMIIGGGIDDPDSFIETAIGHIADPTTRALALADWRYAPTYLRTHPLFSDPDLLAATMLSSQTIDDLWAIGVAQPA